MRRSPRPKTHNDIRQTRVNAAAERDRDNAATPADLRLAGPLYVVS